MANKYEGHGEGRVRFEMASEEEKEQRLEALEAIFTTKSRTRGEGVESDFDDFFRRGYKHANRYDATEFGLPGESEDQVNAVLEQAVNGNNVIRSALDYYRSVDDGYNAGEQKLSYDKLADKIERVPETLADRKSLQLNVENLRKMFEWSVTLYSKMGKKSGNSPPEIASEQMKAYSEDLEDILRKVNAYR